MSSRQPSPTEGCHFVVISLASLRIASSGPSAREAAEASDPGTCFGYGKTERIALTMALQIAERCRRNDKRLGIERSK